MNPSALAQQYKRELLERVIPFWERHSPDPLHGGYFTCLDRRGQVYDTDKFVWLQGRQVWMFATLYNSLEHRPEWLQMARQGADFLRRHGRDPRGHWYFALTRAGAPLVQPYNIFSDCFATMAFAQLARATGDPRDSDLAATTFNNIMNRRENPKGPWNKGCPGTRPLKNFSLPMILCNLALEIEHLLPEHVVTTTIEQCLHEVMELFYDPGSGLIRENILPDGSSSDSFEGRLLNPGHAIEAMWFVMDLAQRLNQPAMIQKAVDITLRTLEHGWDQEYGGIFYFLDRQGYPPQQLEWDQKLWWVHIEALISLIKGYALTGRQECLPWFDRLHAYTWDKFPDPDCGEWYGYLNRRGEVLLPLKGGKWKGCFHVPRGLLQISRILEEMSDAPQTADRGGL